MDKEFFILYFVASDELLSDRLVPCKWNQAWRPSELYRCIEREKDNFKSREVNCLKECALALSNTFGFIFKLVYIVLDIGHDTIPEARASLLLNTEGCSNSSENMTIWERPVSTIRTNGWYASPKLNGIICPEEQVYPVNISNLLHKLCFFGNLWEVGKNVLSCNQVKTVIRSRISAMAGRRRMTLFMFTHFTLV